MPNAVEEAAERLYGLPLEDFVRERDAAAKALRREDRDAAASVAALRKPSAHAWAVNQAVRRAPELRDELLGAGDELREAQEAAIAGGGRTDLRAATARERAAVDALLEAARAERPSGRALSGTAVDRLRRTLHAAAGDEEVREAIATGRLVADAEGGGAWPFAAGEAAPAPARRRRSAPDKKKVGSDERKAAEAERRAAEEAEAARRREVEAQLEEARRERGAREREHGRAEREAQRSAERLERALADAEEARERADAARAALEGARTALDHARDAVARLEEQL